MLDILILAALALIFLGALYRRLRQPRSGPALPVAAGALLLGFIVWWYLLGPAVTR